MDGYCSKVLSSKQQFNTCAKNILLFSRTGDSAGCIYCAMLGYIFYSSYKRYIGGLQWSYFARIFYKRITTIFVYRPNTSSFIRWVRLTKALERFFDWVTWNPCELTANRSKSKYKRANIKSIQVHVTDLQMSKFCIWLVEYKTNHSWRKQNHRLDVILDWCRTSTKKPS